MTIDPVWLGVIMPIFLILWFVSMMIVWNETPPRADTESSSTGVGREGATVAHLDRHPARDGGRDEATDNRLSA